MSIYPIVRIQLPFVQFSLLCYEFCILSKTECKSIYYHFRRDHESSNFRKLARNKWICRETCDFFRHTKVIIIVNVQKPLGSTPSKEKKLFVKNHLQGHGRKSLLKF